MILPKQKVLNLILFSAILIWCIGILGEFVVKIFPSSFGILPFLKYNYSIVCHTDPEKLINFNSLKTMTCSRCTGIYFGGLMSSILLLFSVRNSISIKVLLLSAVPLILDVFFYSVGIYNYSKTSAMITGFLLGSIGFNYIQNIIIDLFVQKKGES